MGSLDTGKLESADLGADGKHEIVTAYFPQWGQLKNGELLRAAEEIGIGVFVTGDRTRTLNAAT